MGRKTVCSARNINIETTVKLEKAIKEMNERLQGKYSRHRRLKCGWRGLRLDTRPRKWFRPVDLQRLRVISAPQRRPGQHHPSLAVPFQASRGRSSQMWRWMDKNEHLIVFVTAEEHQPSRYKSYDVMFMYWELLLWQYDSTIHPRTDVRVSRDTAAVPDRFTSSACQAKQLKTK